MRAINDNQASALKGATRRAIKAAGTAENFQHVTRVKAPALSVYASTAPENMEKFIGIDVAVEADLEAGAPIITEQMARILGYKLVKDDAAELPPMSLPTADDMLTLNAAVAMFVEAYRVAAADNHIDESEKRSIGPKGEGVIAIIRDTLVRAGVSL
ncbi:hypothetical protein [Rhizobium sp.]|uniref:hypothetical protein n=1 Tax=Rhizobium sp. TaxID=391 RepID=UPI000E83086E|nr:hypothetical protein [Rhizobium sp.]